MDLLDRVALNRKDAPPWLAWETVLSEFGPNLESSLEQYVRFVETGLTYRIESPWQRVVAGVLLGSPKWMEKMRRKVQASPTQQGVPARRALALRPSLDDIVDAVCRAFAVEPLQLAVARRHGNDPRLAALYLGRKLTATNVTAMAQRFGRVSPSAVSKLVRQTEARRLQDGNWNQQLTRLEATLRNGGRS